MKFHIKASVRGLNRERRRKLDAQIMAIFGEPKVDVQVDGNRVWRKFGKVELFDNSTLKVIYGDAEEITVAEILKTFGEYGCKLTKNEVGTCDIRY